MILEVWMNIDSVDLQAYRHFPLQSIQVQLLGNGDLSGNG
jgi:hypothetical protein